MLEKYIEDKRLRGIAEWLIAILIAFIVYMLITNYVFKIANIMGNSMEPTLDHGDKVVINRFTYIFSNPQKGDIIAFPYKENPSESYVKRIVAAGGDEVDFFAGRFWVNGDLAGGDDFDYNVSAIGDLDYPLIVPENRYFVLGDNRNSSNDSRNSAVGFISKKNMVGKISFRILPFNKIGSIN